MTARGRWLRAVVRRPAGAVGAALVAVVTITGAVGPALAPHDPFAVKGPSLTQPSWAHPMGTDALGRDTFSGVLHGMRTSVLVALAVAGVVIVIGLVIGMLAGYVMGRVDDVLMRATEFVQVLPRFFLAILVIALFGPGIDRLVLVLGLTSWTLLARVVRAEVFSLREREFVEAARADGASGFRIVTRELIPNVVPATVVTVGLVAAQVMLIEASLSFLGLGDPNVVSLGSLASQGQQLLRVAWWTSIFPGVAIL
ncbi:MAG: ABC transporter permease, partial [Acidimicrobiales bacterium]